MTQKAVEFLSIAALDMAHAIDGIDTLRINLASVQFCRDVYERYTRPFNTEQPNEHMDPDKARTQLLDSIARLLGEV